MMQQYTKIKAKYQDALLFFRLGDFYELFGEDAIIAAQVLDITLTSRDRNKENALPMCGVPHHAVTTYLEKLIKNGFKVAICEQLEDPKTAKGVVKRDVIRVVTPGTYLEGNFEDKSNVFLVGLLKNKNNHYGLAVVDLSTGEFKVTLLNDGSALEDELSRIQPAEIVFSHTSDFSELNHIFNQLDTTLTKTDARNWYLDSCQLLLLNHFKIKNLNSLGLTNEALIKVAGGVLTYLKDTQRATLEHITHISAYSLANFLQIDNNSQRNLELTKTLMEGKKTGSLFGVLDKTVTSMGGRLLRTWIENPLIDPDQIIKRQQSIRSLINDNFLRMDLTETLHNVLDLERLLSKLVYGSGNARDLIALKISLQQIPKLKKILMNSDTVISNLSEELDPLTKLVDLIEVAIIHEPPLSLRDGNLIKTGFNSEVDQLRAAKGEGKTWITTLENQERQRTGIKSLKVGFNKVFGYYIEVTKSNIQHVPDNYHRKQTLANAERYITPELKEKEAMILGAEEQIVDLEYRLFNEIRSSINDYIIEIQKNARILAKLDVFQSLSQIAIEQNYVCPEIVTDQTIELVDGRHPVIDFLLPDFVPNDLSFSENQQILLLTGPNMAGKSTFLRQAALIVIMAQIGSYVPASTARIGIVDRIFTRIGAADDLSTGQSTFMVECSETAHLVRHATKKSLIILDELGRGTSTFDGMAIAQAVIEYLHNHVKARTLFSTHYHELTTLETTLERLTTYQMAVEDESGEIYFLHKVMSGSASKSYGINVAKMAGIPQPIIKRSENLLYQLESGQKKPLQLDLLDTLNHPEVAAVSEANLKDQKILALFKDELNSLDINQLTPLAALQLVNKLQNVIKQGDDSHE